ncbi:MAG: LPS assembly protein LptD [Alphaproteobacteria bacterium]|nr:LPS assembly protein LptD [Alphaproteobacteria bacterium]
MFRIRILKITLPMLALLLCHGTLAAPQAEGRPLLSAESIRYDQDQKIAIAIGKVELVHDKRVIRAQRMTYNQLTDVVTADGNVTVIEPDGNVIFADHAEITGDMKRGFVSQIGMVFTDNSRFAALEAEKVADRYTILRHATYSPCNLCKEDRTKPPLWQMRAARVTHDDKEKRIIYRDAFMEIGGVPVMYTPYFSHPDPSVKRKSGFLTPNAGHDQNIGNFGRVPYYFYFTPDQDFTVSPTISQKDGFQFAGQYRERLERGKLDFTGSFVNADRTTDEGVFQQDQWRGHLFGNAVYNVDRRWRLGADIAFTSDKSYLYRYNIPTKDVLKNRGYIERFSGRHYAALDVYYFQDIRPGIRATEPVVAPNVSINMVGEPGKTLGGRWAFNGNMVALTRSRGVNATTGAGPDSRRVSAEGGWERTAISKIGLVTTLSGSVRFDTFWADKLTDPNNPANKFDDAYTFRAFPQANLVFRYPFGRRGEFWEQIVEPIVAVTSSPRLRNYPRIANEDSIDVEFDETSLFDKNRFTGVDLLEGGHRVTYGARAGFYSDSGKRVDVMFGQSYRFNQDPLFPTESGLRGHRSDYVGRIELQPASWLQASYGFRLDAETFTPRRSEVRGYIGPEWFRASGDFLSADTQDTTSGRVTVSELTAGFSSHLFDYWNFSVYQKRAIKPQAGLRNTGATIAYIDECLTAALSFSQDETSRPDLNPGTAIVLSVLFKNLGGFTTDALSTNPSQR